MKLDKQRDGKLRNYPRYFDEQTPKMIQTDRQTKNMENK